MSLDRIHVYELTDRVEDAGPGRVYRARVVEAGGPLPIESEVHVIVVDADDAGGEDTLRDLVHAHGIARQYNLIPPTMDQPQYNMFHRHRVEVEYGRLYEYVRRLWAPREEGRWLLRTSSLFYPEG